MIYLMLAVYLALHIIDWRQTLKIARNPGRWWEINPLLGGHPSVGRVYAYFSAGLVAVIGLALLLPQPMGMVFAAFIIGIETGMVFLNYRIGLGV